MWISSVYMYYDLNQVRHKIDRKIQYPITTFAYFILHKAQETSKVVACGVGKNKWGIVLLLKGRSKISNCLKWLTVRQLFGRFVYEKQNVIYTVRD